jgi:hypothetical protein
VYHCLNQTALRCQDLGFLSDIVVQVVEAFSSFLETHVMYEYKQYFVLSHRSLRRVLISNSIFLPLDQSSGPERDVPTTS